jgi:dihydroorotase
VEKASALGLFAALFLTQVIATMAAARALTLPLPPAASALRLGGRRVEAAVSRASRRPLSVSASSGVDALTITTPDDWHLHVRDDAKIASVVPFTARSFARALIMPNLVPPVRTTADASAYRDQILAAVPPGVSFEPQMTLYLTDNTTPEEIARAHASGFVRGCKLYPAGATTNSDAGVTDVAKCMPALEKMAELGLVLEVHGEVTHASVDMFDREKLFLERVLQGVVDAVPELKIVMEHITTEDAVAFCEAQGANVAATITPQHLLLNRNAMLVGGIRPHLYCLPILKRESHRAAVAKAAVSGSPKFFLGTDSAPHPRGAKESACGCAGVFSAHAALAFYAMAFEREGALDKLEGFASHHGADFYGVPRNEGKTTLERVSWTVPETYEFGGDVVVPFYAGEEIPWSVKRHPE